MLTQSNILYIAYMYIAFAITYLTVHVCTQLSNKYEANINDRYGSEIEKISKKIRDTQSNYKKFKESKDSELHESIATESQSFQNRLKEIVKHLDLESRNSKFNQKQKIKKISAEVEKIIEQSLIEDK